MTPAEFYADFQKSKMAEYKAWAKQKFDRWVMKNYATYDQTVIRSEEIAMETFHKFAITDDATQEELMEWLYEVAANYDNKNESMNTEAQILVNLLLEGQGQTVEVEYRTANIDSMPHTIWMIRAAGSGPTAYLATGTGHSREDAERQVAEQARLLGVTVARVTDRTPHE